VSNRLYTYDISKGNIQGHTPLFKFGSNSDVGLSEETIWYYGGLYPWV